MNRLGKENPKTVLITGGTGSFGKAFAKFLLTTTEVERLVIFSRDELKQFEMQTDPFFETHKHRIRYFLGDVRDVTRLQHAFNSIELVVHAAALKQVVAAEYNPIEAIKTNVIGAQNVIEAAIDCNVKYVIALSTDKAAAPINLYGATKLCSDKLFVAANNFVGGGITRFGVVRYGNVFGSRGSVVPYFLDNYSNWEKFPVTDLEMTRFSLTLDQGVRFVFSSFKKLIGSEIFVPRIPSYRLTDLCKAIDPEKEIKIIGIRPGEKLHELMITSSDLPTTYEWSEGYVILPSGSIPNHRIEAELNEADYRTNATPRAEYCSGTNTEWLTVAELRHLLREFTAQVGKYSNLFRN